MADPRFFKRAGPFSLAALAELSGALPGEGADENYILDDVAPLDKAGPKDLSFLDNIKYKDQFSVTRAGACFIAEDFLKDAPAGVHCLVSPNPYKAYALAAQYFYPAPLSEAKISKNAFLDKTARLGKGCLIEDGAVIQAGAEIGENTWIGPHAVIGRNVTIGAACRIGAGASVSHALIGDYVRLYPGVRIGQDGFGFAVDPSGFIKVPQLGRVLIEDNVEIGANTTIDRGAGPDTIIGRGTWIDNLVQIGHNVQIGRHCVIVSQVGISGSTKIDDFVMIGGQAGIAGHLHIGKGAKIAAQSGVMRDIPAGEEQMGYPALPMKQFMRQIGTLNKLIKKK